MRDWTDCIRSVDGCAAEAKPGSSRSIADSYNPRVAGHHENSGLDGVSRAG
jgi:hypothetical protein